MHISDGYLPPAVSLGGLAVTGLVTTVVMTRFREDDLPRTAVMSSLFFAASAISVPLPIGSVHLLLTGLLGIVLGWKAFPAIFTALLLQLLMLGYGGPLALGVNTLNLAGGAVAAHYVFRLLRGPGAAPSPSAIHMAAGFAAGIVGVLVAGLCYFLCLLSAGKDFHYAVRYAILLHLPIVAVEALITGQAVLFLARVKPELLARRAL